MKKRSIIAFLIVISVLLVLPFQVCADSTSVTTVSISKKGNEASKTYTFYTHGNDKIKSVKSSDTSVATTSFKNYTSENGYTTSVSIRFKKLGTVMVTEEREGNGGTSSHSYKAVQYKAPVKTLKLGKTDLSKSVGKSYAFEGKPFNGKVSFKLNKGWKFLEMYKFKASELLGDGGVNKIPLKKNAKIKLAKGERLVIQFAKGDRTQGIRYTAK